MPRIRRNIRGQPEHDAAGGQTLRAMGFPYIGDMISVHTDLGDKDIEYTLETKVVYLADKFVSGTSIIPLESRFQESDEKFATTPEIKANIARRRARALRVKQEFELLTGSSLNELLIN